MTNNEPGFDDLLEDPRERDGDESDGPGLVRWADDVEEFSSGLDLEDADGVVDEHLDGNELVLRWRRRHVGVWVEMLRFDRNRQLLRISPRVRNAVGYTNPFSQVQELQVHAPDWDDKEHSAEGDRDGLLHVVGLPRGFSDAYAYGLGIIKAYRGIVHEVEDRTRCTVVRFTSSGSEGVQDAEAAVFAVSLDRFDRWRRDVDTCSKRASVARSRVVEARRQNAVADLFGLEPATPRYTSHRVIDALTEEIDTGYVLSDTDRDVLVDEVSNRAPTVARSSPARFGKLRDDIELVTLEVLIEQFDRALSRDTREDIWQRFFTDNPFALQQLFAAPILVLDGQVSVRSGDAKRRGGRVTDFLCVNTITRSAVVVEIKTPRTPLMHRSVHRGQSGAEVFPPHLELSRAVSQVQSQMESVPRHMTKTPSFGRIEKWHVRGAVVAGTVAKLDKEQRTSFLRYRDGLAGVTVLGYDEVGDRLKALRDLLSARPPA